MSTVSAGFDHITTESLKSRGIRLGTTPDALTDATADIGAMLALLASRRGGEAIRSVVDGKWPTTPWSLETLCGRSIQRSTVGVLGFGRIGQMTLKRLIGFGIKDALYSTSKPGALMSVSLLCDCARHSLVSLAGATLSPAKDYYNLVKEQTIPITPAKDLDELAARSDFLIICCSLTPQTKNLIDAKFLAKMSPHSYVINTARGGIVDSQALDAAVRNGVIAGAGLDVVDGEPNVPADHFLVQNQRIVLTPHIGSATIYTRTLMCEEAVTNLAAGLGQGEWVNQVEL